MGDDLKSFKISDQVKTPVDKTKSGDLDMSMTASAGFPRIEALIENDSVDLSIINSRLEALQALSTSAETSSSDKTGARKASLAYKHLNELIEHLVATKSSMLQNPSE